MKNLILLTLGVLFTAAAFSAEPYIAAGLQPQISTDTKGVIRLVYGRNDSIFCSTSVDGGDSFLKPVLVGHIPGMHLGMSRGPQIASSAKKSLIAAIDKSGNIHSFQLLDKQGDWQYLGLINDIKNSAPEGLMSLGADEKDTFYAVWLDIRKERKNNIGFSSLSEEDSRWNKNQLIYISPEGNVCECCKPSISVSGSKINVMFRNWTNGSRDLYLTQSEDQGKTFHSAKKLGTGTWKLKGCPMDGGGITTGFNGRLHTVWQREGSVYYCRPDEREIKVGEGRNCSIAVNPSNEKVIIAFQDGDKVKIMDFQDQKESTIGVGSFLKTMVLPDGKVFCAWEQDKKIRVKKIG